MEYDTYSIIIDSNEYSTDGYKLENINLSKDKDNIIVDIFVFAIGELNTAASYILFINDVGSQIFIDNTCDIEIKHNPISENYVFFNQHKLQCDYYNRLIKNIFINVGDIHSNLNTINTYNSNDIVVDFFYAEEQSEIIVPTKNYINFSFSITDENNISTGGKINGDSEDFENLIVASIEYDLFD